MTLIQEGKTRTFILWFIRILLLLAIATSYNEGRILLLTMSIIAFLFTYTPYFCKKILKKEIPSEFELLLLFFIYGFLIFLSVRINYHTYFWWNALTNLGAGIILGIIGFTIITVLTHEELLDANSTLIATLAFCIAFTLEGLWEIFEYGIDTLLGTGLQLSAQDIMTDLIIGGIGALLVSIEGYDRIKNGRHGILSFFILEYMKKNYNLLTSKKYFEYSSNKIRRLIEQGEGEQLEFKSTLRKNLYTKRTDKTIEHAALKTIVAYLNTKGGTLLIGVNDKGNIKGIEEDDFENHDKLKLYLTTIIRRNIGNKALPYINFELYPIEDKHILRIRVLPAKKRMFLQWEGKEEFYARYGPSSIHLQGNDLIDYVNQRFKK